VLGGREGGTVLPKQGALDATALLDEGTPPITTTGMSLYLPAACYRREHVSDSAVRAEDIRICLLTVMGPAILAMTEGD
jgi:hypothetical protein